MGRSVMRLVGVGVGDVQIPRETEFDLAPNQPQHAGERLGLRRVATNASTGPLDQLRSTLRQPTLDRRDVHTVQVCHFGEGQPEDVFLSQQVARASIQLGHRGRECGGEASPIESFEIAELGGLRGCAQLVPLRFHRIDRLAHGLARAQQIRSRPDRDHSDPARQAPLAAIALQFGATITIGDQQPHPHDLLDVLNRDMGRRLPPQDRCDHRVVLPTQVPSRPGIPGCACSGQVQLLELKPGEARPEFFACGPLQQCTDIACEVLQGVAALRPPGAGVAECFV